jgi:hypothetical protein
MFKILNIYKNVYKSINDVICVVLYYRITKEKTSFFFFFEIFSFKK